MRHSTHFEEWIARCEETIKAFLTVAKVDLATVGALLEDSETRNWRDVLAQPSQSTEAAEEEAAMPRAMTKALEKETADVGIQFRQILM